MDRLIRFNVIATSGRAVEAAGDVDTLLLDKTGTITFGNRMATEFMPVAGVTEHDLAEAALLASASPTKRRKAARSSRSPRATIGLAEPKLDAKTHASFRSPRRPAFRASTSAAARSARARSMRSCAISSCRLRESAPPEISPGGRAVSRCPAARRSPSPRTAGCSASSISRTREARHQGALRGAARHGHQDRDGDRRQSGHRRGDRLRSRRRRLSSPRRRRRTSSPTSARSSKAAG